MQNQSPVHTAAVPLVALAALTLASAGLYQQPFFVLPQTGEGISSFGSGALSSTNPDSPYSSSLVLSVSKVSGYAGLYWPDRSAALSIVFWLVVGPACYLGCVWWYRRRAERVGLSLRWQPWAYAGAALMGVIVVALIAQNGQPLFSLGGASQDGSGNPISPQHALSPLLAIALGLLVLARAERSCGTAIVAVLYGAMCVTMNLYQLGTIPPWVAPPNGGMQDLLIAAGPNLVLLSAVLLIGAAILQLNTFVRRHRNSRPDSPA